MSPYEYKAAKAKSGISIIDTWCSAVRISKDQDKAYSSGRTPVPPEVAFNIRKLIQRLEEGAAELRTMLQEALPNCSIKLDDESLIIEIIFTTGKKVQLHNKGIDLLNFWPIYEADSSSKGAALFLRTPQPSWEATPPPKKDAWYLWRGDFVENRNLNRFQSYWNMLGNGLLLEAFKRYT